MTYDGLQRKSARERLGLVKVGDYVMTGEEAGNGPSRSASTGGVAPRKAAAVTPAVPKSSAHDLRAAEARARDVERQRWETVMLSDAVTGRERIAAAMLASSDDSTEAIMANLAKVRTDAERQRASVAERQARAGAVWDRAIASVYGEGAKA